MKKRVLYIFLTTLLFQNNTYSWDVHGSPLAYGISGVAIGAGTILIYKAEVDDISTIMAGSMCISAGLTLFYIARGVTKVNPGTIMASLILAMTVPTVWANFKLKPIDYGNIRVLSLSLLLSSAALFHYANQ